jgi:DeoR/GlpR family transcriptional regulator of sugar metabolism
MEKDILAVQRRSRIIEAINASKSIVVGELSRRYSVSEETIRRDLDKLQKQGYLIRTYGGAVLPNDIKTDFPAKIREGMNTEAKICIARKAAALICNGDCIFIDASSSSYFLSKAIKDKKITVITNAINVITELSSEKNITLISTGGKYYSNHLAFFGSMSNKAIERFNANKVFFSCKGISREAWLTDSDEMISESHRAMMIKAEESILLCDSTKFGRASIICTSDFSGIGTVITEKKLDEYWTDKITGQGTRILYA